MKCSLKLGTAIVLFWSAFLSAQTTSSSTENKSEHSANSPEQSKQSLSPGGHSIAGIEGLEVLSDTQGVDFSLYLQRVLHDVREHWYEIIPESAMAPLLKKGKVSIEFAIMKNGHIAGMRYVSRSGDVALDRTAYGGITASNPFPPLPEEFGGQYLGLRMSFLYNPSLSGISPRSVQVHVGSSQQFSPVLMKGQEVRVSWSVVGRGCAGSACGTISDAGLYIAPLTVPANPTIIVRATEEGDFDRTVSTTVTIVP